MTKFLLAGCLALAALGSAAGVSRAGGWIEGRSAGFGPLGDKCLMCFPGIHQHGPLYNYTPMQGDYTWMKFHWYQLGNYYPATPLYYPQMNCNRGNCFGNAGHDWKLGTGAFANCFHCGLHTGTDCGGTKWFGWFNSGCGGTWSNIFHRGGCESCPGPACTGCTGTAPAPAPVKQTSYSSLYPDYLTNAGR